MANFKLFARLNGNQVPITVFESNQKTSLAYATFDESFSISAHDVFDLTFSMAKFIYQAGTKKENSFFSILMHGTEIRLSDKDENVYDGIITKISYEFSEQNTIAKYTVQDKFSYELSNRNLGYAIQNDDQNFIGALKLDAWARKIVQECRVHWNYNSVDAQNNEILQALGSGATFNSFASFSCSGVSALGALRELADSYGMQLKVNYSDRSFGFIPTKNPLDRGFRMNPKSNLMSLGISTDSQPQVTIMNVLGGMDYQENPISILNDIPPKVLNYFNSSAWKTSKYSNDLYYSIATQGGESGEEETAFLDTVNHVPWLENKLINFEYFNDSPLMSEKDKNKLFDLFYNDLRIINGQLIFSTNDYLQALGKTNEWLRKKSIQIMDLNSNWETMFKDWAIGESVSGIDTKFFEDARDLLSATDNIKLADRSKLLTLYRQEADKAEQTFLENIYYFKKYWNGLFESSGLSNGIYYCSNYTNSDPIAMRNCVEIKANLTKYWSNAVTAGKYSNYYLPSDWDRTSSVNKSQNYDNPIYNATPANPYTWLLNDNLIPNVGVSPKTVKLNWVHSTESSLDGYIKFTDTMSNTEEFEFDGIVYQMVVPFGIEKEYNVYNWYLQPLPNFYETRYSINYIPVANGGSVSAENWDITGTSYTISLAVSPYYTLNLVGVDNIAAPVYETLSQKIVPAISTDDQLFGIYTSKYNKIKVLGEHPSNYQTKKEEQNQKWLEIYREFGDLVRENNYNNTEAPTSRLLLDAALQEFKDSHKPEVEYSLGMIDIYNIKNAGSTSVKLTDKVLIEHEFFEDKPTQIQNLLKEPLYITGISYFLRSDADIDIKVNSIRYADKLINRLASLL